ncbi:MAG: L-threonylcarbamoyladenylate synthase [Desulfovibrionaceae bacterium]|nr:L-threonylcarbamoyladenylate synthase [Desulfovibrionaceae bacterium]
MLKSLFGHTVSDSLDLLVRRLKEGGCLVYPTETLFGLGCDALNADAVAAIYQAKERSATKPLPLIAADVSMAARFCRLDHVPRALLDLWPGPLTLLLPAAAPFAAPLVDARGRVALRVSAHPGARALVRGLGRPMTATSANRSGRAAADDIAALDPLIVERIGLVADLPPHPAGGLPSTIVSVPEDGGGCTVRLHREGAVSASTLESLGLAVLCR